MDLEHYTLDIVHHDAESMLYRGRAKASANAHPPSILVSVPTSKHPGPRRIRMLEHELSLRAELDSASFVRPLALARHEERVALILEDQPGEPLRRLLEAGSVSRTVAARRSPLPALEIGLFLRLAAGLAAAVCEVHQRGIIHKNIKPAHLLVNAPTGRVWLTGFGIASRLPRERQTPEPPETIAGTLAYMAPEQTGRMNRSIDTRADLYAIGVTLYEALTGSLPFMASDPMEWVHCHIARQPIPPHERVTQVAVPISAIIMKLLAKTAEERYQTAAGLERDLRRCLEQLDADGRIDDFALGAHDTPDRLLVPEKLYGRASEIETLLAAFDRVVHGGPPELVLVSGYSGIGKSSVVNELHKVLVPPRGLFAAGKFDQYKRDIPYATVVQAFQGLIQPLLGKSEAELRRWRDAFGEALGPNGRLMVDLVPELKLIIGEQAPLPELSPQETQRRFQRVFQRFLAVFAQPEHPLALFLDDLQWLDAATLELLEGLLTQTDVRHVLLIGAYRDNEVSSGHPLMRTLDAIRARAPVHQIVLGPLSRDDVGSLMADSLYCDRQRAAPLAELVHEKTAGNPFFLLQFLSVLVEEELLTFDHGAARWFWDSARIRAKGYTDNVVDLMIGKLSRLPPLSRKALQQLACIGSSAGLELLALDVSDSNDDLRQHLQEALRSGLVFASEVSFRFLHDRVQEAAYSLIPEAERAAAHLRIGRLLANHTPLAQREEAIFEIVNQLNRGAALIESHDEKAQLAELNLIAGKRAKASTAYASALQYLSAGAALLSDAGHHRPGLLFALELQRAECEFSSGQLGAAEAHLATLASRATSLVDRAAVACLQSDLYTTLNRSDRAIEVCLGYLRHLSIEWSPHPTKEEAQLEYERIWTLLDGREIEQLIDLPVTTDAAVLATLDVLIKALSPAMFTDPNLCSLLLCRMINISLEHGITDASCYAYAHLAVVAGPRFGNYDAGFRFGQLGFDLLERRGLRRLEARTVLGFAVFVGSWTKHLETARQLLRKVFDSLSSSGDHTYAAFALHNLIGKQLAAGDPLLDVQREAERALEFVRQIRFDLVSINISTQLGLARTYRGATNRFGCFDDAEFDELEIEQRLSTDPGLAFAACWYWIRKLQARFAAGEHAAALEASLKAEPLLWMTLSFFEWTEAQLYGALNRAALCDTALPGEREQHVEALRAHHRLLAERTKSCPENFANRELLVRAEIARVEGRELDAERLYEAAIESAGDNGFVQNEALANELAARFHAARGFETISRAYLRNARDGYVRWGADGKVRQLDRIHPHLRSEEAVVSGSGTIGAPIEQLDLATVLQVSEAVAGEMVLEKLLDTLMRTAMEHAGADRALLLLPHSGRQRIVAEATTAGAAVTVTLRDEPVESARLPESVLHYVLHTRESVLLDDAMLRNAFSADPYIGRRHARSILCLPLSNQAKLIGVLYLENSLAARVFLPARISVLKLLASQAAISLENARLYRELAEREARIRRLLDANIIGICIWEREGRIVEANDAFLSLVGYDRHDLSVGLLHWTTLIPPEWRERADRFWMPERGNEGTLLPFEAECSRKDGGLVPVLIGMAAFEEPGEQGVAFVLDLSERRRTQEALNRARAELAHVSRVTALGALTASIAHEVSQPLSGIVTNATTCLRMLSAPTPNLEAARETVRRTIRDGNRTTEVIIRLRALFSKREATLQALDLNEATREVIALSSDDLQRSSISLQLQLTKDVPAVLGDRIQIQQVILNLIRNAADAMADIHDRPRRLLVKTEPDDNDGVRMTIRDAGVGLPSGTLGSLFNPFYTTKSGGMGIGLFVCQSIVEKHRGRLWAEPNQDGPGATFSLFIPRAEAGAAT
jgi:PAS domain S-box-containing protein